MYGQGNITWQLSVTSRLSGQGEREHWLPGLQPCMMHPRCYQPQENTIECDAISTNKKGAEITGSAGGVAGLGREQDCGTSSPPSLSSSPSPPLRGARGVPWRCPRHTGEQGTARHVGQRTRRQRKGTRSGSTWWDWGGRGIPAVAEHIGPAGSGELPHSGAKQRPSLVPRGGSLHHGTKRGLGREREMRERNSAEHPRKGEQREHSRQVPPAASPFLPQRPVSELSAPQ